MPDANVLIFGDALVRPDAPALLAYLDRMKLRCQADFAQEIVWITVNSITRVTTGDTNRSGWF